MRVNFIGGFFGTSGYASHCRNLALATKRLNAETSVLTQLGDNWQRLCQSDEEYELVSKEPLLDGVQVVVANPITAELYKADKNKGVLPFMVFEGDKAPKHWQLISQNYKLILTPSKHSKDSLIAAGIPAEKIVLIPHGFDPKVFNKDVKRDPALDDTHFNFLWNKGWTKGVADRTAFHIALKAFLDEFREEPLARFVVHVNPAYVKQGWSFETELSKLNVNLKDKKCTISVTSAPFTSAHLASMYKSGNCLIGTSRAEAFNIPVLESLAVGTPVITSEFGGQVDFAKEALIVKGKRMSVPIVDLMDLPLYEQAQWEEPDVDMLRAAMKKVFLLWKEKPAEYQAWRARCADSVKDWTWENSAKALLETISELEEYK